MKTSAARTETQSAKNTRKHRRKAYHVAWCGRESVSVYKRTAPGGSACFMVANYAEGKRRFDSYADENLAIEAAGKLARQMSERQVVAAAMTNEQASEYAAAKQKLAPFNVGLLSAADAVAQCLESKLVADLSTLITAAQFYHQRHKHTTPKRVADVVAELLKVKEADAASKRYLQDLRARLNRFAESFQKNIGDVTTAEISTWLYAQKNISPQTRRNYRRVLQLLFTFAVAGGYAVDSPIDRVASVKVRNGENIVIFTPAEITRLLEAATPDFLPCLVIGAFAGLRSAEIERLEWSDIHLAEKFIVVGKSKVRTAGRRIVPMADNLCAWLKDYTRRTGKVWKGTHEDFYEAQQVTAAATKVEADLLKNIPASAALKWKANGLRHSFASYRFAEIGDAGRVAGECGNSAATIHKHYRELVKPADALKWFSVRPEQPANVTTLPTAATA